MIVFDIKESWFSTGSFVFVILIQYRIVDNVRYWNFLYTLSASCSTWEVLLWCIIVWCRLKPRDISPGQIFLPGENESSSTLVHTPTDDQLHIYPESSELLGMVHVGSHAHGAWIFYDRAGIRYT